jgi:hypothetical protein
MINFIPKLKQEDKERIKIYEFFSAESMEIDLYDTQTRKTN